MPRDSNGVASTDPVYLAVSGETIRSVQHNTPIEDIVNMLTGSLARNGTGGMNAALQMGGFKIQGVANGTLSTDAAAYGQLSTAVITSGTIDGATIGDTTPSTGKFTQVTAGSASTTEPLVLDKPASYYNFIRWKRSAVSRYWFGMNNSDDTFLFYSDVATSNIFSIGLTGVLTFAQSPLAPTPAASDSSTKVSTTAHVHAAINNDFNVSGSAPKYACRAWVNFNGGTSIRGSGNISSITDTGLGLSTINFATAMPDANYSFTGSAKRIDGSTTSIVMGYPISSSQLALQIATGDSNGYVEPDYVFVEVVR